MEPPYFLKAMEPEGQGKYFCSKYLHSFMLMRCTTLDLVSSVLKALNKCLLPYIANERSPDYMALYIYKIGACFIEKR